MLMSATSYSDLFLFPLLEMFDVHRVTLLLHTSACPWGLAACGAAPRLLLPLRPQGPTCSTGKRAGQGALAAEWLPLCCLI